MLGQEASFLVCAVHCSIGHAQGVTMIPTAYTIIWVSLFLLLVLACSAGTIHAQSTEQRDQPTQSGGQTGAMPGQRGMEGMQGGQDRMVQTT